MTGEITDTDQGEGVHRIGRPVTIRDVAEASGVSPATVSRALNGSGLANPEVRRRILETSQRLGYTGNRFARGLRSKRTKTIGLLSYDLSNETQLLVLRGAQREIGAAGYTLLIADGEGSVAVQGRQLESLLEHQVDGVILSGPVRAPRNAFDRLVEADIPFIPRFLSDEDRYKRFRLSGELLAHREAFEMLADEGHERFGFVIPKWGASDQYSAITQSRLEALVSVLQSRGLKDEGLVVRSGSSNDLVPLLTAPDRPTALIAATHSVLPMTFEACRLARLTIPGDISLVGYGNSIWIAALNPPASIISRDMETEGRMYATTLLRHLAGEDLDLDVPFLPSSFKRTDSCGPAPSRPSKVLS
jgi:LacI family transcriptional regulator